MPFHLEENDLEAFVGTILDAVKEGRVGRATAVQLLSHAIIAAASDKEAEFKAYIRLSLEQSP
jgi:hypothetical protein